MPPPPPPRQDQNYELCSAWNNLGVIFHAPWPEMTKGGGLVPHGLPMRPGLAVLPLLSRRRAMTEPKSPLAEPGPVRASSELAPCHKMAPCHSSPEMEKSRALRVIHRMAQSSHRLSSFRPDGPDPATSPGAGHEGGAGLSLRAR